MFRVLGIYNFAHILKEVTMKRVVYKLTVASPALSHMFTDWEEDRRRILRWSSVFLQNQFSSSHFLMNCQTGKLMFLQVHCCLPCLSHMFTDWEDCLVHQKHCFKYQKILIQSFFWLVENRMVVLKVGWIQKQIAGLWILAYSTFFKYYTNRAPTYAVQ